MAFYIISIILKCQTPTGTVVGVVFWRPMDGKLPVSVPGLGFGVCLFSLPSDYRLRLPLLLGRAERLPLIWEEMQTR